MPNQYSFSVTNPPSYSVLDDNTTPVLFSNVEDVISHIAKGFEEDDYYECLVLMGEANSPASRLQRIKSLQKRLTRAYPFNTVQLMLDDNGNYECAIRVY